MKEFKFIELWNRLPENIRISNENCIQDVIYHPEGSVFNHTKMVFEHAQNNFKDDVELLVCAIFHDIAKPDTKSIKIKDDIERISHHNHENVALSYVDKYIYLYSDITTDVELVKFVVENHMRMHKLNNGEMKDLKKINKLKESKYFDLLKKFSECDSHK